ncbi:ABC-type transport auxiliary lipoprotein family protein [Maricaulis maris]|uniref:Cholesterol transport system auxiliary component n=1 Tax=Maricaulis maris TaxID=74318 RepID=A0A495DD41_9PROT|nr:ABC-type transport auxiliary lipoprotein family protein [Maricaulis maris]RKR00210.1 cholesterol transport system auxiliary component [Maricaulis maris]
MSGSRFIRAALAGLTALSVSACVSLLPESEPVNVYRLSSPEPAELAGENWVIIEIDTPNAPRGLSGDQIAIMQDGVSLAYISGARWISPAPRLLQTLVIDTFNANNNQLAPTRADDGVRADYELRLDMQEFEAVYDHGVDAPPLVRVRIAARLVAEHGRRFAGARVVTADVRASANRTSSIVAAFDQATRQTGQEIADWTAIRTASSAD